MTLGERMLEYRAKHKISQLKLAVILDESVGTIYRCESENFKLHKVNEIRLKNKMNELEEKDNVQM